MKMTVDQYLHKCDEYEELNTEFDEEYEFTEADLEYVKDMPDVFTEYLVFLSTRKLPEDDNARLNKFLDENVIIPNNYDKEDK